MSTDPVQVPDLGGLNQAAAAEALTAAGLTVGTVTNTSDDTIPAGRVIGSSPAAGAPVDSGTSVNLEVSSGPANVAVPEVMGKTQAEAETALKGAGLALGRITPTNHPTAPKGNVTVVNPAGKTLLAPGSAVDLEISSGPAQPDQIVIPNVTGLNRVAAETSLKAAGLVLGSVTTVTNTATPAGNVTAVSPSPGTLAVSGSTVNLEVSSGAPPVSVPNVIGLNRLAADALLRSTGLVPGEVTTEASPAVPAGGISTQHPPSGTLMSPGESVAMALSTGVKLRWWQRIPWTGVLIAFGCAALIFIFWSLKPREGELLEILSKQDHARGLITFLVALTTVVIGVILALSTIALEDSPENDKRFDRGKQIFSILIGVLGTIIGFYFGRADDSQGGQQPGAETQALAISTESLPAVIEGSPYRARLEATGDGTLPLRWTVSPSLPEGFTLDEGTGVLSAEKPQRVSAKLTFTVTDGSTEPKVQNKDLTLESQ